jgi:hypothetical protein
MTTVNVHLAPVPEAVGGTARLNVSLMLETKTTEVGVGVVVAVAVRVH